MAARTTRASSPSPEPSPRWAAHRLDAAPQPAWRPRATWQRMASRRTWQSPGRCLHSPQGEPGVAQLLRDRGKSRTGPRFQLVRRPAGRASRRTVARPPLSPLRASRWDRPHEHLKGQRCARSSSGRREPWFPPPGSPDSLPGHAPTCCKSLAEQRMADVDVVVIGSGAGWRPPRWRWRGPASRSWCSSSTTSRGAGATASSWAATASAPASTTSVSSGRAARCGGVRGLDVASTSPSTSSTRTATSTVTSVTSALTSPTAARRCASASRSAFRPSGAGSTSSGVGRRHQRRDRDAGRIRDRPCPSTRSPCPACSEASHPRLPFVRACARVTDQDPLLRAILAIQCGDHGLGPSKCPSAARGGHRPLLRRRVVPEGRRRGDPQGPDARPAHGGESSSSRRASSGSSSRRRQRRRAVGVRLTDGTKIRAKHVISNADPHVTFGRLVGEQVSGELAQAPADAVSVSGLSLFLALDVNLRRRGFERELLVHRPAVGGRAVRPDVESERRWTPGAARNLRVGELAQGLRSHVQRPLDDRGVHLRALLALRALPRRRRKTVSPGTSRSRTADRPDDPRRGEDHPRRVQARRLRRPGDAADE